MTSKIVFRRIGITGAVCLIAVPMLQACPPPNGNTCFVGSGVTIPSTDATPPTVVLDFHLPDGKLVTVTSGSTAPIKVTSTTGGTVTLVANANDPEGVKDIQLWVGEKSCHTSNGLESCSGPGLLGAPTASNPDNQAAGATGCTQRVATQNVQISMTANGSVSQEVHATGVNFGGGKADTALVTVGAQ